MENYQISAAYLAGPNTATSISKCSPKRAPRRSKLEPYKQFILRHKVSGKSYRFICHRLKIDKKIICQPSTALRFINKILSAGG